MARDVALDYSEGCLSRDVLRADLMIAQLLRSYDVQSLYSMGRVGRGENLVP